jgi:uncharacterized membrane protein
MYLLTKLVHIAAVIVFLGNIGTGLFWHQHALRSGAAGTIAHAVDGIIRSDRWLTVPGVLVIVASGIALALQARLSLFGTGWIRWTLLMFIASGLIYGLRIAPLQRAMLQLAQAPGFDPVRYRRLAWRWELWGLAALLTPIAGLVLMVLKPAL